MKKNWSNKYPELGFTLALLAFATLNAFADEKLPEIPTFPPGEFRITTQESMHGNVKISVTNAKRIKDPQHQVSEEGAGPVMCAAWMSVHSTAGTELSRIVFNAVDALGGKYGLFVLPTQPSKDLFMLVFCGNYDDQIIVIDKDGKVVRLAGCAGFQTRDMRYLVTIGLDQFAIFDLKSRTAVTKEIVKGVYGRDMGFAEETRFSKTLGYLSFFKRDTNAQSVEEMATVYLLDPSTGEITTKEVEPTAIESAEPIYNKYYTFNFCGLPLIELPTEDCGCE